MLDPRLGDRHKIFVSHVEVLPERQHVFFCGEREGTSELSLMGSLFVLLQNDGGKYLYSFTDHTIDKIIYSMSLRATLAPNVSSTTTNNPFLNHSRESTLPSNPFLSSDLTTISGPVVM